jgi:hypothetical protein
MLTAFLMHFLGGKVVSLDLSMGDTAQVNMCRAPFGTNVVTVPVSNGELELRMFFEACEAGSLKASLLRACSISCPRYGRQPELRRRCAGHGLQKSFFVVGEATRQLDCLPHQCAVANLTYHREFAGCRPRSQRAAGAKVAADPGRIHCQTHGISVFAKGPSCEKHSPQLEGPLRMHV